MTDKNMRFRLARLMYDGEEYGGLVPPIGAWHGVEHWPLYAPLGVVSRFMSVGVLVRDILARVPGDIAEVGCHNGANLIFLAHMVELYAGHNRRHVYGFDTFEGLQDFAEEDGSAENERGLYIGDLEFLRMMIRMQGYGGRVELVVGDATRSIATFMEDRPAARFAMVYSDTDLYEPTLATLEGFHERVVPGGCFVLDQWNEGDWPGETQAADEFMVRHGSEYAMEPVQDTHQPTLVLRKRG
jgi:SAM-dependent methyltransferase